ncbi:MAG: hypothetical protein RL127_441 [Bacteroidota bacterium]|jgi:hypothetical protein
MKNHPIKQWPWIVAILVLINVGSLLVFWINERHHIRGSQPKEFIAHELRFDEGQKEAFEIIVKKHQDQSAEIRHEITAAKKAYYKEGPTDSLALLSLTKAYGKLEILNYEHFKEIRSICKGDQKQAFDQLLQKIIAGSNFGMGGQRPRP